MPLFEALLRIARWLESRPWNRPGSDKTWVLVSMTTHRRFMRAVRSARASSLAHPFVRALATLASAGVDFIVVGVGGINFFAKDPGEAVATRDLDVLVRPATEVLGTALRAFDGAGFYIGGPSMRSDAARRSVLARLRRLGARVFAEDVQGMFLWADLGTDTNRLATRLYDAGYVAAPGSLFSPTQLPSTWMRFNVASSQTPAMWRALQNALA